MSANQEDGMKEYRRLVEQGIRDLSNDIKSLEDKVDDMRIQFTVDITTLKVKAGLLGTLAGIVASTAVTAGWEFLKTRLK